MATRNLYALLVGINEYDSRSKISSLKGCVNDIYAMSAYLKGRTKCSTNIRVLIDAQATRAAIISGFKEHLCQATSDDIVLFYYAGHGSQANAPEEFWPTTPSRILETLVCYDSRIDEDHWDLADKELAYLIAEVDKQNPHTTIILDCCHSGSGTRDTEFCVRGMNLDTRKRPLSSFIFYSDHDMLNTSKNRGLDVIPSALKVPVGRHIVFSACLDQEKAKEQIYQGKSRGVFSYFFQETLMNSNSAMTCRELFKRVNALVRLNVPLQSPQIEATHSQDLTQLFLEDSIVTCPKYFTVSYHKEHQWIIDGGSIHGIFQLNNQETTTIAIFPYDASPQQLKHISQAITQAPIVQIFPQFSKIDPETLNYAHKTDTFKAIVISFPLPPLRVSLSGEHSGISILQEELVGISSSHKKSPYIQIVNSEYSGDYSVLAKNNTYQITRANDSIPVSVSVKDYSSESVIDVVQKLEHISRWKTIAELASPASSQINGTVDIKIYTGIESTLADSSEITNFQTLLQYYFDDERMNWVPPRFRIKLYNNSNETLYCALFYLTELFKAEVIKPDGVGSLTRLSPNQEIWYAGGAPLVGTVPDSFLRHNILECRDTLKLIACTDEFDPTLMNLGEIGSPKVHSSERSMISHRGSLNRLMSRVNTRNIDFAENANVYDDWVTNQLILTFRKPRASL